MVKYYETLKIEVEGQILCSSVWRDAAIRSIQYQLKDKKFKKPWNKIHCNFFYYPSDTCLRSIPDLLHQVFDVIEISGIIKKKEFINSLNWVQMGIDKKCSRIEMEFVKL